MTPDAAESDLDMPPYKMLDKDRSPDCPPCPECVCPEATPCRVSAVYRKSSDILNLDPSREYKPTKARRRRRRKKANSERAKSLTQRKDRSAMLSMGEDELIEMVLKQQEELMDLRKTNKRSRRKGKKKKDSKKKKRL